LVSSNDRVRSFSALILELPPKESGAEIRGRIFYLWEVSMSDYTLILTDRDLDLKAHDALHFITQSRRAKRAIG
jgi:hypothetical protein